LLRRLRAETRLTQEELAEAAGVSPRSVSDLERGINRTARKETAVLLARALGLPGAVAELFVAAARGRGLAGDVVAARQGTALGAFAAAATRGLPRDVASFTGRRAELDRLAEGLDGLAAGGGVVGICAIGGMAGVGKTTFAVHATHRLAGSFPDGQFYLPLHGHTRGQRPVDPADALSSLLLTAGVPGTQVSRQHISPDTKLPAASSGPMPATSAARSSSSSSTRASACSADCRVSSSSSEAGDITETAQVDHGYRLPRITRHGYRNSVCFFHPQPAF
jgi:transcriptional regulator with XRE-family HTH domain